MNEYIGKNWFEFKFVQDMPTKNDGVSWRRYELREPHLPFSETIKRCYNSLINKKPYEGYPIKEISIELTARDSPRGICFNSICLDLHEDKRADNYVRQLTNVIDEIDLEISWFIIWTDTKKVKSDKTRLISGTTRQNVLMRDNYTCQICGATVKDGAKLEIDHIIPYSKGGTNDENNLQVLCQQCNREKHNRSDLLHDKQKLAELKGV